MHNLKMMDHPNDGGGHKGVKTQDLKITDQVVWYKITHHFYVTLFGPSFSSPKITGCAFSCLAFSCLT